MGINGDILSLILKMLGVSKVTISTDQPDAIINLTFERYDQSFRSSYRLSDLIEQIQGRDLPPGEAPEGYTDITSIPTPDPSSG